VVARVDDPVQSPAASPSQAVVEDLRTAKVVRGDSLWRISRTVYGEGMRYTTLYDANNTQIRNPNRIYPGQVLVVPKK
jgi:nucleoid-associated protein YgaU